MKEKLINVFKDEEGQGMVEYGLILGLISLAAISVIVLMGPKLLAFFTKANDNLNPTTP